MASSLPEANLTRTKELGKYSQATESQSGNVRPHDKSRSLTAEEVDIIRMCAGCGKNMRKVKNRFVCSCKWAIHCSKECFNSSKHRCEELGEVKDQVSTEEDMGEDYGRNISAKFVEVIDACVERYRYDRSTGQGPSTEKVARLKNGTKGNHQRILKYAESRNPAAAYVVGSAYVERNFDQRRGSFAIPLKYKEQSVVETNEVAVKWLKVAAERGIPEAMFLLFRILTEDCGLRVDRRVAEYWLAQAHASGKMEYLIQLLEIPKGGYCFPTLLLQIEIEEDYFLGSTLADLLMAARFREIKAWGGKTGMEEPFYGWKIFNSIVESIGEIDNDKSKPSFICGEKKTVQFISARHGNSDVSNKVSSVKREENNLKFKHGAKSPVSHDFELVRQTSNLSHVRTSYLISCKHDEVKPEPSMVWFGSKFCVKYELPESVVDNFKSAGECVLCTEEARRRLRAVSLGLFSLSLTPVFGMNHYAARYANEDGIIVQDVFGAYSKPSMRQTLQCLMSNPADLHPLAVAEDAELFWPIIWFWGSVYEAVEDACNNATLGAIYHSLGDKSSANLSDKKTTSKIVNSSAMEAFPEDAAGEWRIACGNDDCPRVDHEVKFNLCAGCGVRRYCDAACQKKDWPKHSKFCAAAGGAPSGMPEGMGGMPGGMGGGTAGAGPTIEEVD